MKQSVLAASIGVSAPIISQWQSGRRNPTPVQLVKMANLAPDPLGMRFLELAGITAETLKRFIPEFESAARRYSQQLQEQSVNSARRTAAVPIVGNILALAKHALSEHDVDGWISVDTSYVPATARAIRLKAKPSLTDASGSVINPRWHAGVVVLDTARPIDESNAEEECKAGTVVAVVVDESLYFGSLYWREDVTIPREEVWLLRFTGSPFMLAFRQRIPEPAEAAVDVRVVINVRTGEQSPLLRQDTGGRFIFEEGIRFILPALQSIYRTEANRR